MYIQFFRTLSLTAMLIVLGIGASFSASTTHPTNRTTPKTSNLSCIFGSCDTCTCNGSKMGFAGFECTDTILGQTTSTGWCSGAGHCAAYCQDPKNFPNDHGCNTCSGPSQKPKAKTP
jgi:hypothetical protein